MKIVCNTLVFLVLVSIASCSGDDASNPPVNTPASGFTWTENSSAAILTASNSTFSEQYKTFMVKDADDVMQFEINLTATSPGTYEIGSGNAVTYTRVNPFFVATSGNVTISAKSGGKVSGTFDVSGSGSGITTLKGSFNEITIIQ